MHVVFVTKFLDQKFEEGFDVTKGALFVVTFGFRCEFFSLLSCELGLLFCEIL